MKKNISHVIILGIVVLLTLTYTIASTYSVIINVTSKDGINEIINKITIRDLAVNDDGSYNSNYYNVKNTLNITDEEANILMDSVPLNNKLQIVLNSIVEYKINNINEARLTNDEVYNLIIEGLNEDENMSEELKNKVIDKSNIYKDDINDFLYDIEVSVLGDN